MTDRSRPFPLVLAAPSGAGKTSLARALVDRHPDLVFALSATTRPPRAAETHGQDYHFVDDAEFDRLAAAGELLEWARVHGRRYGTMRSGVESALAGGQTVVLDIDVQGAHRIRQKLPDAVFIFVLPPSAAEMHRRLATRASETREELHRRLVTALEELGATDDFDYIVVNDDFEETLRVLEHIVDAERRKVSRAVGLSSTLQGLQQDLRQLMGG